MLRRHDRMQFLRYGDHHERGALTIFTAILVLVLMTLMVLYATRVGLFESRTSANDVRQKIAFGAAETALDQGIMYILANSARVLSGRADAFPDGEGGTTGDGWLATGVERWQTCVAAASSSVDPHPCDDIAVGGTSGVTGNVYYYDSDGDVNTVESMLTVDGLEADAAARVTALLCFVDLSAGALSVPTPCGAAPADADAEADASLVLWILGYGFSDCADPANVSTCTGYATVAWPLANHRQLSGSPVVPWTTKAVWPPSGNATVVGNPNAGGLGVVASVWANCNDWDPCVEYGSGTGTWETCELQEWYGTTEKPAGVACTLSNCNCKDPDEQLSNKFGGTLDVLEDPAFPDDLFEVYFNVPREEYMSVKNSAQVLTDCGELDVNSSGLYWIDSTCKFDKSSHVIGSPTNPVVLVTAGDVEINGGLDFYGVVYFFDYVKPDARIKGTGNFRVYGAGIADIGAGCDPGDSNCGMKAFQGTLDVIYADGVLASAAGIAGLGGVIGGWRDFGLPEIAW